MKHAILTLILTIGFVSSPAFTRPFTGFRADQLPIPQIDPPVQPAGYAFAIWGLIYGWLLISAIVGVFGNNKDPELFRARLPLMVSLAVGIPWLAIANASAIWATVTIVIMAVGAILALWRAPVRDPWRFETPVGIYAGWLTAASFVSLGSTMAGYGFITDAYGWAFICIGGAFIAAIAVYNRRKSAAYLLTVIWALVGIIVANGTGLIWVSGTAAAGIVILLGLIAASRVMRPAS